METHTTHDALLAVLDAHTDAEPAAGWAATDADGTLWASDVADEAYRLLIQERLMRRPAAPALARLLALGGEPSKGDPHEDAAEIYRLYLAGRLDDWPVLEAMTACYAGWTVPEVRAFARRVFEERIADHVYVTTAPLLRGLLERGLSLVVVSGSPGVLVEEAVRGLGFDVPVRGVEIVMDGERWGTQLKPPVTWEAGKVDALEPLGAGAPWISFGDTLGDLALLKAATRLRVLVHPRPSLIRAARADGEAGWCVLAPPRTVGGAATAAPRTDRTIV